LRFVDSTHRSFNQVYAELEFIEYLDQHQANVSTMIHTTNNELLVKIDTLNEEYFSVCAFTKAKGRMVEKNDFSDEFFFDFGKAVGKLHRLTKDFKPVHRRYHWHEEDYIDIGRRNLPQELLFVVKKAQEHTEKLKRYKTDIDSYGLIHTDLHFGNMFFDGKELTFFD